MVSPDQDIKAIKIKLMFFGSLSESMGHREIEVVLSKGTKISQLMNRFQLSDFVKSGVKVAINGEITDNYEQLIEDSSEVAFLPPFSGG